MKKLFAMLLTLAMLAGLLSACGSDPASSNSSDPSNDPGVSTPADSDAPDTDSDAIITGYTADNVEGAKIGIIVMDYSDSFMAYLADGVKAHYEEKGASVDISDAQYSEVNQVQLMENYAAAGYDQIITFPMSSSGIADTAKLVRSQGVQLMVVGMPSEGNYVPDCERLIDNYLLGKALATAAIAWADEVYGADAEAGSIHWARTTNDAAPPNAQRAQGMLDTLAQDARFELVFSKDEILTAEGGVTFAEEALAFDPDIKVFMNFTEASGLGINEVLTQYYDDLSGYGIFGGGYSEASEALVAKTAEDPAKNAFRDMIQQGEVDAALDMFNDSFKTLTNQYEYPYLHYDGLYAYSSHGWAVPESMADGVE